MKHVDIVVWHKYEHNSWAIIYCTGIFARGKKEVKTIDPQEPKKINK